MIAPDKLYVSHLIYDTWQYTTPDPDDETEVEYIRKDALLEWLETLKAQSFELRAEGCGDVFYGAQIIILEEIIHKIKSL